MWVRVGKSELVDISCYSNIYSGKSTNKENPYYTLYGVLKIPKTYRNESQMESYTYEDITITENLLATFTSQEELIEAVKLINDSIIQNNICIPAEKA